MAKTSNDKSYNGDRGTSPGSMMILRIKRDMSAAERREWEVLDRKVSRMWRNFWIAAAHRRGHSYAEIAKAFEISESAVRNVLTKQI